MTRCAVMISSWNGAVHLERCLPSVIRAAEKAGAEVWVLDNGSTDGTAELCRTRFPSVRLEQMGRNLSFTAYNVAARASDAEIVVSLDSDVLVDDDFLAPLLEHFAADDVFAVTSSIRGAHDEATAVQWRAGMLRSGAPRDGKATAPVFYNCSCATARDRRKLLELGGLDRLFLPLYFDDTDLSWRAWKHGWRCLYDPRSVVYHEGGGSLGRTRHVSTLMARNEFLFHWKNLTTPRFLAAHLVTLLPRLVAAAARGDTTRLAGFALAIPRLPELVRSRRRARTLARLGDAAVVARINGA